MRIQGRKLLRGVAPLLIVTSATSGALLVNTTAHAATTAPTLTLANRQSRGDIEIKWSFTTDARRSSLVLEVERTSDVPGTAPATLTRRRPGRHGRMIDTLQRGTVTYRARLVVNGVPQPWGPSVSGKFYDDGYTGPPIPPPTNEMPPGFSECAPTLESEMITLMNQERAKVGSHLLATTPGPALHLAAHMRAIQLGKMGVSGHAGFSATARAAGANWTGENVYVNTQRPADMIAGFLASPTHRQNMLYSGTSVGVGCVFDDKRGAQVGSGGDVNKGNMWVSVVFGVA